MSTPASNTGRDDHDLSDEEFLAPEESILKGWLPTPTPTDGPAPAPWAPPLTADPHIRVRHSSSSPPKSSVGGWEYIRSRQRWADLSGLYSL